MPKVLTPEHKAALRAGRDRRNAKRHDRYRELINEYREWVRQEAEEYAILVRYREIYGADSDEVRFAEESWRAALSQMPSLKELPDDKTWRSIEGRDDE